MMVACQEILNIYATLTILFPNEYRIVWLGFSTIDRSTSIVSKSQPEINQSNCVLYRILLHSVLHVHVQIFLSISLKKITVK